MTNFTTVFILPNSTSFDIIRTFVHTLLTIPDPRELEQVLPTPRSCVKSHLNDKPTCCLPLRPQSRHSDLWYFGAQLLSLQPCCLRLAHYITVTHSRLASNAVVSSLFDRISTCRIARPLLDARSGTNVV